MLTCMLFMASRSCSSWCAEFSASRRMSVSFISFSHSSDFSSDTTFSSPSFSSLHSWILMTQESSYSTVKYHWWGMTGWWWWWDLHRGGRWLGGLEKRGWVLSVFMSQFWRVWSRGVWGGNLFDIRVHRATFRALLNTERLAERTPQLQRNIENIHY